jgi:hypothetical protein
MGTAAPVAFAPHGDASPARKRRPERRIDAEHVEEVVGDDGFVQGKTAVAVRKRFADHAPMRESRDRSGRFAIGPGNGRSCAGVTGTSLAAPPAMPGELDDAILLLHLACG